MPVILLTRYNCDYFFFTIGVYRDFKGLSGAESFFESSCNLQKEQLFQMSILVTVIISRFFAEQKVYLGTVQDEDEDNFLSLHHWRDLLLVVFLQMRFRLR